MSSLARGSDACSNGRYEARSLSLVSEHFLRVLNRGTVSQSVNDRCIYHSFNQMAISFMRFLHFIPREERHKGISILSATHKAHPIFL